MIISRRYLILNSIQNFKIQNNRIFFKYHMISKLVLYTAFNLNNLQKNI